jgi:hypothetical protein
MLEKVERFLLLPWVKLIVFFVTAVLFSLVIFHNFYPQKIPFKKEYFYLLHFLVIYLNIYLIIYIWKTKEFLIDGRRAFLVALNFLIYVPFYLLIKEEKIAEKLAIWAYYAMVL